MLREANINDAKVMDDLLTLLVLDEAKYDNNIDTNFKVDKYYKNFIERDNNIAYVYEEDNKIIGYIDGQIVSDGTEKHKGCKISALYVLEEYRGKGIATKLIEQFIKSAKDNKCYDIEIGVMYENKVAKQLYKKFGFKEFKEVLDKKLEGE